MLLGKRHVGEYLLTRAVHHRGEFLVSLAQRVGDMVPLLVGGLGAFLSEDRLEHGDDGRALLGTDMRQRVLHPVHPAALLGRMQHLDCGAA